MQNAGKIGGSQIVATLGKVSREYLDRVIYHSLGSKRHKVLVGPHFGVDNAVVRIGTGRVLVVTTDPLSFIPELGARESAWLSVNLLASDLTTSGFPPQYGVFDFNLPPTMKDSNFTAYWDSFHRECSRLGLAIVGGHTGRYEGCDYTIIGGGVMFAEGPEDSYLTSSMAHSGDDIILTKGAAVETTAVLAHVFPRTVRKALGSRLFERACRYLHQVTTVQEALTAVTVGVHSRGVTAMHDTTEGGVTAGVLELGSASRLGVEIDLDSIQISQETREICRLFRIDPLTSLSEGSLMISCEPGKTGKLLSKLHSGGIAAGVIGRLTKNAGEAFALGKRGRTLLKYPKFDPYWGAYQKAVKKGWT
jgi:hydrogenase expression/formation protein HypE